MNIKKNLRSVDSTGSAISGNEILRKFWADQYGPLSVHTPVYADSNLTWAPGALYSKRNENLDVSSVVARRKSDYEV